MRFCEWGTNRGVLASGRSYFWNKTLYPIPGREIPPSTRQLYIKCRTQVDMRTRGFMAYSPNGFPLSSTAVSAAFGRAPGQVLSRDPPSPSPLTQQRPYRGVKSLGSSPTAPRHQSAPFEHHDEVMEPGVRVGFTGMGVMPSPHLLLSQSAPGRCGTGPWLAPAPGAPRPLARGTSRTTHPAVSRSACRV